MADFSVFDNLVPVNEPRTVVECTHEIKIMEKSTLICSECGLELEKDIFLDKDKYPEIQARQDISRCQVRKVENKNIYKDVEDMGFGERIVSIANDIYTDVTGGKIYRGNSRKAIVFACIYHAYLINKTPQDHDHLIKMFNLKRKCGLKGLKIVHSNIDKNSPIKTSTVTPADLITDIMKQFNATKEQIDDVVKLYEEIKDRSSIINRARPQSTSAGLVYYYILKMDKNITMKDFLSKVKLSELTIKKVVKELDKLFKTNYFI